jgi:hypothetical protein
MKLKSTKFTLQNINGEVNSLSLPLKSKGFSVAVYNRTFAKTEKFLSDRVKGKRISGFENVEDFVNTLESPRKVMMMLKAGPPVDGFIGSYRKKLASTCRSIKDQLRSIFEVGSGNTISEYRLELPSPELMAMFNHSRQRQTLDYLCIQAEKIKDAYMRLEL